MKNVFCAIFLFSIFIFYGIEIGVLWEYLFSLKWYTSCINWVLLVMLFGIAGFLTEIFTSRHHSHKKRKSWLRFSEKDFKVINILLCLQLLLIFTVPFVLFLLR